MTNPFQQRFSSNPTILMASGIALLMGFMLSLAWITNDARNDRIRELDPAQQVRLGMGPLDIQDELKKLREEVGKLRSENDKLQNAMSRESGQTRLLNDSLKEIKRFAGLTEVVGPGLIITLRDTNPKPGELVNDSIIHDTDVVKVVNELWNAGAEAIAVNNIRVVIGTNFRCVGSTILVDSQKIASPVVVQAIGEPKTLNGAMELPGGILAEIRSTDPKMVELQQMKEMKLPAYSGSTTKRYLTEPKEKDSK